MQVKVTKLLNVMAVFEVSDEEEISELAGRITAVVMRDKACLAADGAPLVSLESWTVPHSVEIEALEETA